MPNTSIETVTPETSLQNPTHKQQMQMTWSTNLEEQGHISGSDTLSGDDKDMSEDDACKVKKDRQSKKYKGP